MLKKNFKYDMGVFMINFVNSFLLVNFKCYFRNITKVHSHLKRSSKAIYFLPRF